MRAAFVNVCQHARMSALLCGLLSIQHKFNVRHEVNSIFMCSPFGTVLACAMIHPLIACVTASYAFPASFLLSRIPSSTIISTSSGLPVRYTPLTILRFVALPMALHSNARHSSLYSPFSACSPLSPCRHNLC